MTRDLRNPQLLGEALLRRRTRPLSAAYDRGRIDVPDVTHDDSMQKEAQEAYKETLETLDEDPRHR